MQVQHCDVQNNFFLQQEQVGEHRADAVVRLLQELNPHTTMHVLHSSPTDLARTQTDSFWTSFDLVIATQCTWKEIAALAPILYALHVPFLNCSTNGLLGHAQLATPQHCIIESHPEGDLWDLCLYPDQLNLFPEYKTFLFQFDLQHPDANVFSHIPFPAILAQLGNAWVQEHGRVPLSFPEKQAFKQMVQSRARHPGHDENYTEAVQYAYLWYTPPTERVPSTVSAVLQHQDRHRPTPFWIMVDALCRFCKANQDLLPLSSQLPDMTCRTEDYVAIQRLFRRRIRHEATRFHQLVAQCLQERQFPGTVPTEDQTLFLANVRSLRVEEYRPMGMQDTVFQQALKYVIEEAEDKSIPSNMHWYVAFRSSEAFRDKYQRYPGEGKLIEQEKEQLYACALSLLHEWDLPLDWFNAETLDELIRYGHGEVPAVAALMGGLGAQAALKLITKQYVPWNNVVFYNGIDCSMDQWSF